MVLENVLLDRFEQTLQKLGLPVLVELWNGKKLNPMVSPHVTIRVRSLAALKALIHPSLGELARKYVRQEIDLTGKSKDLLNLGAALCNADQHIDHTTGFKFGKFLHTRLSDKRDIQYHYDVSNSFYGLWLDKNRVYSCAYFKEENNSLDLAQENKLDYICRKLLLKPNERFLDIGCGWGGLIMWAAEHFGVQATGITLSNNQYEYVTEEISRRNLSEKVSVKLMDYRDLPENDPFDKVASVGMFEHVGKKNLPIYFLKIHNLLRPGGLVMNHGITSSDTRRNGLGSDISQFVDEYVFPNGELVHISHVLEVMSNNGLECRDVESLRPHYAKTLWNWVERLEGNELTAVDLVGEDRYRIWRIYMAGSAFAFERNWISLFQVVAGRPFENGELPYPLTRAHLYQPKKKKAG